MSSSKWNHYLISHNLLKESSQESNLFSNMTDYLSFFTGINSFSDDIAAHFSRLTTYDWFKLGLDREDFGSSNDIDYFLTLFSKTGSPMNCLFWLDSRDLTSLTNLSSTLASNLMELSLPKNNPTNILKFFPDHKTEETLFDLELWFADLDSLGDTLRTQSTPDTKLFYPEPFIASPSFTHEEIWFIHILHYNYWLWFFFISLIMFYFITFINVVRWCNLRSKPKRETRGVSRSKCADLITACVPVSWAISIIISETVDATDYYDGFGTGEIVIGIRAYQWGWEYFYPKNIDLNYNVKPSYSSFIGNSIKYNNTSSNTLDSAALWKHFQKKNNTNQVNLPSHVILSPNDANSSLNNIDFSSVGNSISNDISAFEGIKKFSKSTSSNINRDTASANSTFSKINNLYLGGSDVINNDTYSYGSYRQHNLSSGDSLTPTYSTLVDKNGLGKFYSYSLGMDKRSLGISNSLILSADAVPNANRSLNYSLFSTLNTQVQLNNLIGSGNIFFSKWLAYYSNAYNMNLADDVKGYANPFKTFFKFKNTKKLFLKNSDNVGRLGILDELSHNNKLSYYSWDLFNNSKSYRFKDIKSPNMQFLSPDKNLRSIANKSLSASNINFNYDTNTGQMINKNSQISNGLYENYLGSEFDWVDKSSIQKVLSTPLTFSNTHTPLASNNPTWNSISYDRLDSHSKGETPSILSGKEELAPEYLFSPYWYSYYKGLNLKHAYSLILQNANKTGQFYLPHVLDYSEYDFRNNQAQEALEDAFWESNYSAFSHEDYILIKKNSLQGDYFNKPRLLYNSTSRTLDKKAFVVEAPAPFLNSLFSAVNSCSSKLIMLDTGSNNVSLNANLINNSLFFIDYVYSILFKITPIKKALFYTNWLGRGYYFNFSELFYSSVNSNLVNTLTTISTYQKGISNVRVDNINSIRNLNGLNWDNFNFKGMGSDKYRWFNAIWFVYRPSAPTVVSYYSWVCKNLPMSNFIENAAFVSSKQSGLWFTELQSSLGLDNETYDFDYSRNRLKKFKLKFESRSFLRPASSDTSAPSLNSLVLQASDLFFNPQETNILNFRYYNNDYNLESLDNNYENIKNFKYLYHFNNKSTQFNSSSFFTPVAYTTVLDYFRADFDEHNWSLNNNTGGTSDLEYSTKKGDKSYALTNSMKLRTTAKNSIVTYNAIQKVYKSRFDDSRSNTNFGDFINSDARYPFLLESKSPYESMLGKNKESYFNVSLYNKEFSNNHSIFLDSWSTINTMFLDVPFLLSMKSDASRYLWFDWHSRWSSMEVQPSSIAKYSLAGLPYFSKTFEYTTQLGEELNDSENYLTKLSRVRKNYMSNWSYSPYFYNKISNWYNYGSINYILSGLSNTPTTKKVLGLAKTYEKDLFIGDVNRLLSTPTHSGLNRANSVTWSPIKGLQSHYYSTAILSDILSKREHLYRSFFRNKTGIVSIPKSLTVSPENSLIQEVKAAYPFIEPTTYSSEVTRELLYSNSDFLRYSFMLDFIKILNKQQSNLPINFSSLSNYFIYLLGPKTNYGGIGNNYDLYKSQYRPMRKGITNMIRLQATNAIAMPTEIRLHILASSKDVIHSWAIPSAGIKIDCVPGYSSHRIAIFLTHGIFWGQCMEICGRYHHWMPIVVYFMKRDLFFLWCTHFMHYNDVENTFNMADKQLTDYVRLVSFDKNMWVNELNRVL